MHTMTSRNCRSSIAYLLASRAVSRECIVEIVSVLDKHYPPEVAKAGENMRTDNWLGIGVQKTDEPANQRTWDIGGPPNIKANPAKNAENSRG